MRYLHDCNKCKPLGEYKNADLYYCDAQLGGKIPTIIARYSDNGPDYISGIAFSETIPDLAEAKKRAIRLGFIEPTN